MRGLYVTHELGRLNVEVRKIMTPRPKEIIKWANPMTSNHERDEITTKKKRMVNLKDLKPKIHGRKSLAC